MEQDCFTAAVHQRVLVVPDKFKGTLTADEAARAIAEGWSRARPADSVECCPMTDGGDGFGSVMSGLMGGEEIKSRTCDAAHRPIRAAWWWDARRKAAVIESARAVGLVQLPAERYHPFQLDTVGVGRMLRAVERRGAKRCLIGIGGSATNDGGFGMARALGWRFRDRRGRLLREWWELMELDRAEPPATCLLSYRLIVAIDVENPLLGPHGCTRTYGPQKGLRAEDFFLAEECLGRLASSFQALTGRADAIVPGAGAAGGLGFGLMAFANARVESGFQLFAEHARLDERLARADLVITGEGAIDDQTLMGKGVGQIAARCARFKLPCFGLAGTIATRERVSDLFHLARGLTEITTPQNALRQPRRWLEQLAYDVATDWEKKRRGR